MGHAFWVTDQIIFGAKGGAECECCGGRVGVFFFFFFLIAHLFGWAMSLRVPHFFFHQPIRRPLCVDPWRAIGTDHGSTMIRCTTSKVTVYHNPILYTEHASAEADDSSSLTLKVLYAHTQSHTNLIWFM